MKYKSYSDLSLDINKNIDKINLQDFDLIVGIPRSGMVPAYMVSLLLNVNCIDLPGFIRNEKLSKGITRNIGKKLVNSHDASNILVIDDSISSGNSMVNALKQIPSFFQGEVTTAAVYSTSKQHDNVDIVLTQVVLPRVFEWNIYHHPVVANSCVDIDGVLCYDPSNEQNDDGVKYIDFLNNAKPRFIPTETIDFLVTNRLEKYRQETERWLFRHGVKFNKLIMLDLSKKEDRLAQTDYYAHKADFYKNSASALFIESDINQAIEIANRANKFVFCVDENMMISPDGLKRFKNKKYTFSKIKQRISRIQILRKLYHSFMARLNPSKKI
jgi:uncharacterized HAD superfamily protein/adenine/guanine phosphoribosyltransferase-like PRPP-binding protein